MDYKDLSKYGREMMSGLEEIRRLSDEALTTLTELAIRARQLPDEPLAQQIAACSAGAMLEVVKLWGEITQAEVITLKAEPVDEGEVVRRREAMDRQLSEVLKAGVVSERDREAMRQHMTAP